MITLNQSPVVFDSVKHTYELNGRRLNGITHVIKDKLFPDTYKDVPEATLAKAAERGHRIHSTIELFDTVDITTKNCPELDNYIKAREKYPWLAKHISSEYIVSDEEQYASGIDKVYEGEEGVIIADIKTTYKIPFEYARWQLSVYKYLFKKQNPGVKVEAGYIIWLREDKIRIMQVDIIGAEAIVELLYGVTAPKLASCEIDEELLMRLKEKADKANAEYDAAKAQILQRMADNKVNKIDGSLFCINLRTGVTRMSFDTKAFKADHPEDYEKYVTMQEQKPTISIRVKNG